MEEGGCESLLNSLNFGQKCLLRGLIKTARTETMSDNSDNSCSASTSNLYSPCFKRSGEAANKSKSLRNTLGKLFHKKRVLPDNQPGPSTLCSSSGGLHEISKRRALSAEADNDLDDFEPSRFTCSKGKGRGFPMSSKGKTTKRKIKEIRLKVVGLENYRNTTPIGSDRESMMKTIWIRETGSATDVEDKVRECFGWDHSFNLQFMYASGRNLRKATLDDIENATSWDVSTIRALMGNGYLYITRIFAEHDELLSISSTESNDVEVSVFRNILYTYHIDYFVLVPVHVPHMGAKFFLTLVTIQLLINTATTV